jgi:hypothetical protein
MRVEINLVPVESTLRVEITLCVEIALDRVEITLVSVICTSIRVKLTLVCVEHKLYV